MAWNRHGDALRFSASGSLQYLRKNWKLQLEGKRWIRVEYTAYFCIGLHINTYQYLSDAIFRDCAKPPGVWNVKIIPIACPSCQSARPQPSPPGREAGMPWPNKLFPPGHSTSSSLSNTGYESLRYIYIYIYRMIQVKTIQNLLLCWIARSPISLVILDLYWC